MRIANNIPALFTHISLRQSDRNMTASMNRLSTGLRINSAREDATGMAVANKLSFQLVGIERASDNSSHGVSVIQTAEGALNEVHNMLQRMRELAVQAANDTNTPEDRMAMQREINDLTDELTALAGRSEFNTISLLNGEAARVATSWVQTLGGDHALTRMLVNTLFISENVPSGTLRYTLQSPPRAAEITGQPVTSDPLGSGAWTAPRVTADMIPFDHIMTINGIPVNVRPGDSLNDIWQKIGIASEYAGVIPTINDDNSITFTSMRTGEHENVTLAGSHILWGMMGFYMPPTSYAHFREDSNIQSSLDWRNFNDTDPIGVNGVITVNNWPIRVEAHMTLMDVFRMVGNTGNTLAAVSFQVVEVMEVDDTDPANPITTVSFRIEARPDPSATVVLTGDSVDSVTGEPIDIWALLGIDTSPDAPMVLTVNGEEVPGITGATTRTELMEAIQAMGLTDVAVVQNGDGDWTLFSTPPTMPITLGGNAAAWAAVGLVVGMNYVDPATGERAVIFDDYDRRLRNEEPQQGDLAAPSSERPPLHDNGEDARITDVQLVDRNGVPIPSFNDSVSWTTVGGRVVIVSAMGHRIELNVNSRDGYRAPAQFELTGVTTPANPLWSSPINLTVNGLAIPGLYSHTTPADAAAIVSEFMAAQTPPIMEGDPDVILGGDPSTWRHLGLNVGRWPMEIDEDENSPTFEESFPLPLAPPATAPPTLRPMPDPELDFSRLTINGNPIPGLDQNSTVQDLLNAINGMTLYEHEYERDANGELVLVNGNPNLVPRLDENGDPIEILDGNGNPIVLSATVDADGNWIITSSADPQVPIDLRGLPSEAWAALGAENLNVDVTQPLGMELRIEEFGGLRIQIGQNHNMFMNIQIPRINAETLGLVENRGGRMVRLLEYTTQEGAQRAIQQTDDAVQRVSRIRSRLGAYQNRLEHTIDNLNNAAVNTASSRSRIQDTDMAREMTLMSQHQVLFQAAMAILGQANQRPQMVLQLLQ